MLTSVEIRSARGELLTLSLQENLEGYLVNEIQGLDPVKATLVSSSFANQDGEQYQSSRREARNIIFSLDMVPDYGSGSVRDLRSRLYSFFMPKTEIRMRFTSDDMPLVEIMGRVESLSAPLFTPEPKATISVMAFLPDFYATDSNVVPFTSSPVVGPSKKMTYVGTVDTGIKFVFRPVAAVSSVKLTHVPPNGDTRSMEFYADMGVGDWLEITTTAGNKTAFLYKNSVAIPMLYGVTPQSNWIHLEPGLNMFYMYTPVRTHPFTIEYTDKYGGL